MKEFIEFLDQQETFSSHVCRVSPFHSSVDELENVSVKKNVTYVMHLVGEIRSWNAVRKKYFWERTRITKYLAYHLMCFDTIFFLYLSFN